MGLVINPTAFRIGHVKAWTDAWYLHRMHYPVFVHKSLEIKALLQYVLLRCYPSQWSHWVYSHATYYYIGNKFKISLFVYDGNDPYQYHRLAKKHKYGWFRKSKFIKYWTKKQLLDLQFFYQRWFLLCQAMNFDFEELSLDSLRWRVRKRHIKKMEGLRKKYGKYWVAREDLFIWRFPISVTEDDSYNKMGMTLLNMLFKRYIMPKVKRSFKSRDFSLVHTGYKVLNSHKIFYFFFAYIDMILKYVPTYPVGLFNRLTYKICYRFFRMYFVFKPYWVNLSKLYELILLYINVNSKIKVYLLDNRHLNASYLARYIITCLRRKFDYRDTMIPIKKTLLKIMLAKRWRPIKDLKKKSWEIYFQRYKSLLKDRIYFHLINADMIKMFLYRLKILWKFKKFLKKPIYKKFSIFNFIRLKKRILLMKKKVEITELFYKKAQIKNFYKVNLQKIRYSKSLKNLFFKKNLFKKRFFFFKRKLIRKKKHINEFRRNIVRNIKKRVNYRSKLCFFLIDRLISYKELLYGISFLRINVSYDIYIIKFFYSKMIRMFTKFNFWIKKKHYIRYRLIRKYTNDYKFLYKVKPQGEDAFLRSQGLKWKAVRNWFKKKNRKSMNLGSRIKTYSLKKVMINDYNVLDNLILINLKTIVNFFILNQNYYFYNFINIKKINVLFINWINRNKIYFYNKLFFSKFYFIYYKRYFIRGYSNILFFNFLNQYSKRFKPFLFKENLYKNYIKNIINLNLNNVEKQFVKKEPKKFDLEEMPLKDKFKRLRVLEGGSRSLLYGYKFHFVGRFTRKQKAASLWFAKGANSVSSMRVDVDYGFYTLALRYSACTLKVWLYKNKGYSSHYGYRLV